MEADRGALRGALAETEARLARLEAHLESERSAPNPNSEQTMARLERNIAALRTRRELILGELG